MDKPISNVNGEMSVNVKESSKTNQKKKETIWTRVGLVLVIAALIGLLFFPDTLSGAFNAMVEKAYPVVIKTGILSTMSVSIIISVIMGRLLERLGFTDALMRIFLPWCKKIKINPAVLIPSIYNILGDINASGKISGPILQKTNATKDEKKIAICTMMQSQQSFSTFMLGLGCLTLCGAKVFAVVAISVFLPLIIVPAVLRYTIWRDCKPVELNELPSFTPTDKSILNTLFAAGQEGAHILFMLIIPAFAVVFGCIGLIDYIGLWQPFNDACTVVLSFLNIEPTSGIVSILSSPTLAMTNLKEIAATVNPRLVIGSFTLAASGFPLSVIFGQVPIIWSEATDLKPGEAMRAALLGGVLRLLTAGFIATVLGGVLY